MSKKTYSRIPLSRIINHPALFDFGEFETLDYHLVYSPDDNGWYWERFDDWATSQLFETNAEAINTMQAELAFKNNLIDWEI